MTERLLHVGPEFNLPADAITQSIALLAVRRAGKALALDTRVPTPTGWSTMGELKQGDVVFDERGRQCIVTDAWPTLYGRPCYEVEFSDGTVITADAGHLWFADTKRSRRKYRSEWFNNVPADIYTTGQMAATLKDASGRESNYSVRVAAPLECATANLPVPPYTLGAWLGDGANAVGSVTSADPEIIAEIENEGETTWVIPSTVKAHHASYRVRGLTTRLSALGLLHDKHIPAVYLRASEPQRRALLAGLLDTDGYCSKRGAAEFCSTREQLALDVFHLVAGLGYKPSLRSKTARLYGKPCGTVWTVGFTPSDKVFRLSRKVSRQVIGQHLWSEHRYITAIRPVPSVPVRCIAVDSPNHLYLVTDACISTHNSNAAAVIAEEMYHAALPWVAIDPKGDWWGLRSSRDGKGDGLPVPIFGGLHGDMPLIPEAGHLIADLIADQNLTCVLDVSEFPSKAAQMRFLADLAERLFRLHGRNPVPRHLFLEEADDFIPQVVRAEQARCTGAWTKLVKQGGSRGLGVTLISQRSAVVNKDALTQVETLIALRTTSPQDRKAILGWVDYHAVARELVDSLPGLDDGEAWVCSPHWLARHGQPAIQRERFRQRATYDSGATPVLRKRTPVASLADIDLGALRERMTAVTEKAEQDDPKALRRRIAELERQATARSRDSAADERSAARITELERQLAEARNRPPERVEVPVVAPGDMAALDQSVTAMRETADRIELALRAAPRSQPAPPSRPAPERNMAPPAVAPRTVTASDAPASEEPAALTKAQRAILSVLAQFPDGRSKKQLAMLTRYSHTSGGFNGSLAGLRSAGQIGRGDPIVITDTGREALGGNWEPLPTGRDLIEYWMTYLSKAEGTILRLLLDSWPSPMSRDEIAAAASYSPTSGGFNGALAKLRSLQLITGGAAAMYPDETLAEHAGSVDA